MSNDLLIQPSTFNRRIQVQRALVTTDAGGGTSDTLEDRFTTWASVDNLSTGRKTYLGYDAFDSVYEIKCRYTADRKFTVADLVNYMDGGVTITMQITSVQLVRQSYKVFSVLMAKGVDSNG